MTAPVACDERRADTARPAWGVQVGRCDGPLVALTADPHLCRSDPPPTSDATDGPDRPREAGS